LQSFSAFQITDALGHAVKGVFLLAIKGELVRAGWGRTERREGIELPAKINDGVFGQALIDAGNQIRLDELEMVHPDGILDMEPEGIAAEKGGSSETGNFRTNQAGPVLHQGKQTPLALPLFAGIDGGEDRVQGRQISAFITAALFFHPLIVWKGSIMVW
jgi:hypothetical protein